MLKSVEEFSVFAAAILDRLYDSFPIGLELRISDFVESPDTAKLFAELDETLATMEKSSARAVAAAREGGEKTTAAWNESQQRASVLRGTIEFLIAEGFVRCNDAFADEGIFRGCQLTAIGFSHLHAEFKDKAISPEGSSIIQSIKKRFASSSSVEGAVVASMIAKFLGG